MPDKTGKAEKTKSKVAKVVLMHANETPEEQTVLQQAAFAEKNGDLDLAIKLYKKELSRKAFNANVYTRLMIIYRKQKKYKEELALINKGLNHFKDEQSKKIKSKKPVPAFKN